KNAGFIANKLISSTGRIARIYKSSLSFGEGRGEAIAFLDDYANIIDAFVALYEVTFDEQWLNHAKKLTEQAIVHYYDEEGGIFFFTAGDDDQLIARKSEIMDGVTPASN